MPSQILSGSSNPSYTNNTGQNVRLVINYLQNAGTVTWGSIITQSEASIGSGSPAVETTAPLAQYNGWYTRTGGNEVNPFRNVRQLVIRYNGTTIYDGNESVIVTGQQYVLIGGIRYYPGTYRGSKYGWSGDYCNAFDISIGNLSTIKELMLAPNETFSATSGAYNIVVIKEDGT